MVSHSLSNWLFNYGMQYSAKGHIHGNADIGKKTFKKQEESG